MNNMKKDKIVFFTVSGISKEAGIPTFRDSGGIWTQYDPLEVCTVGCFERDPEKAYGFYSYLHKTFHDIQPTIAHRIIASLEREPGFEVTIVTQNVDDLHEKAGSSNIIHLHGEFSKIQAVDDPRWIRPWDSSVVMHEDTIIEGHHIRPFVVLFGEDVPRISEAEEVIKEADHLVIIGTSLQVYPAASLLGFVSPKASLTLIDPDPPINLPGNIEIIKSPAAGGLLVWMTENFKRNS